MSVGVEGGASLGEDSVEVGTGVALLEEELSSSVKTGMVSSRSYIPSLAEGGGVALAHGPKVTDAFAISHPESSWGVQDTKSVVAVGLADITEPW